MKKQSSLSRPHAGKLTLNKKTISNLNSSEMSHVVGGGTNYSYAAACCGGTGPQKTKNGNTCPGHKTCLNC